MSDRLPPPLPSPATAISAYLAAAATILPASLIWLFSNTFLLPKLRWLWQETNLTGSKAQWIMDASYFLAHNMQFVLGVVVALLIALEFSVHAWPRYRRLVLTVFVVTFHTTVLLGLTAIATSVLLAAPILTRSR